MGTTTYADAPRRDLLCAIHDVGPRSRDAVDRLRFLMARHVDPAKIALLVVPDHWGEAPIRPGTAFAAWLRDRAGEGAEIFLHGWYHRDDSRHEAGLARFKARHMTAGEGEFLGLDRAECVRRMKAGRALLEDVTGVPVAGFIAPAWLYGPGAMAALHDEGFALAEDHMKIWRPQTGESIRAGPVLTWASRSHWRAASSLLAARLLPRVLARAPVVRLATHPGDITRTVLTASIDRALGRLAQHRRTIRYADL
ncbi:hypothetical protein J3E64_002439 [Sphingobium sp. OAS761]|uniref:DUF2334 domain-containing protein n=1 Tax=Sphingobium sp. OAS761 TaxID=2817901 RepID=UPI0020A0FF22|nr:polysaccharide deacetylase family protein [Sphingobium sp. OAS761]MCP1470746.1 hypothetical protein [Sphingobium sp. OAS761]